MTLLNQFWLGLNNGTLPQLGYGAYLLLVVLVALEGPVATLLAAVMAATGALNPVAVFVAAGLGNFMADTGWYTVGRVGQFHTLMRRWPSLQAYQSQIDTLENQMRDHAPKLLLVGKLSLGVAMIPTLIAAGMARLSWSRFITVSLVGEIIWTGGLVLIGYYLANYVSQVEQGLQWLAIIGLGVLGGVLFVLYKRFMVAGR